MYSTVLCIVLVFIHIFALSNTKTNYTMELLTKEKQHTETLSNSERSNSLLIHLSALSSLVVPFGSLILPIILWQTMKKDSAFADHHGKEAVNFNLSFLLYNTLIILVLIGTVLGTVFAGMSADQSGNPEDVMAILFSTGGFIIALILIIVLSVIKLVLLIIAAVRANDGTWYKYPMIIRFIR